MSQKSIFSYFTAKKTAPVPAQSPISKKANAIRSLKKISEKTNESDFELSDPSSESDSDEQEFKKLVTEKKLKKSNKPAKEQTKFLDSSSDSEDIDDFIEEDEPKKKKSTSKSKASKPIAKSSPKLKPKTIAKSTSNNFVPGADSTAAEIAKSASAAVTDDDLPAWLSSKLMDSEKRRPNEPGYDPSTVYIPESEKEQFTPFQKQFWHIKKNNFDAIVMIRKGKFYEMFSVDALFARDVLKLHLTWRGKEPMCGIPEGAFSEWAIKIINAGKRVCKVEQMETAVDQRNRKGGDKAIHRELVQVYSLGTIDDFEMLESSQPAYLLSLRSSGRERAGLCLVDCSTGSFHLGVVNEDDLADTLIRFEPVEVIYNADSICPEHLEIIKHYCGNVATRAKGGAECWDGNLALNSIQRIAGYDEIPDELSKFESDAIAALGGCVSYLNEHKIAKSLLSLQRFSTLDEAGGSNYLALDSSALTNLQIVGKDEHNLLHILDKCITPFGKRRLRFWLIHPLRSQQMIEERLNAVEELMQNEFANIGKKLGQIPDLERMLSRVYSNRCSVRVFVDCLNGLKSVASFFTSLEKQVTSSLLKTHVQPVGKGREIAKQIDAILDKLEVENSLTSNEFIVKPGVIAEVDEKDREIEEIDSEFQDILKEIKSEIGCKDIKFATLGSVRYQVVVPIRYKDDVPGRFEVTSKTKDVIRYHTPEIKELLKTLENVENERLKLRVGMQKRFVDDFASKSDYWDRIVNSCADIDCLISIAQACSRWRSAGFCRPKFVTKDSPEANGHALLKLDKMRHPCLKNDVIPNDANIGEKCVLLITGPNASGKSTYARMCCIAIVLAQIGCYLPAESATLTVFDQIFTRIGASDRLFNGQSTFGVELAETGRLMKNATADSFVVLDELGRGTSTFDGIAIAEAVLLSFIEHKHCPLVFCTHYHVLAEKFDGHPLVRNASMKNEIKDKLILYYELIDGMCDNSFGCKVARLCGLPEELAKEAQKVADDFEARHAALHASTSGIKVEAKPLRDDLKEAAEKLQRAIEPNDDTVQKMLRLYPIVQMIQAMDLG